MQKGIHANPIEAQISLVNKHLLNVLRHQKVCNLAPESILIGPISFATFKAVYSLIGLEFSKVERGEAGVYPLLWLAFVPRLWQYKTYFKK